MTLRNRKLSARGAITLTVLLAISISGAHSTNGASEPYIDFQGTLWARDGSGPAMPSPYDMYHRFMHLDTGQAISTRSNVLNNFEVNAVIEGLELSVTESDYSNFYVDGHPWGTSKYTGGSLTIYLDGSAIITIEDITIVNIYDFDTQDINGYGWGTLTGVSESEGGNGLYEEFTQFSDMVRITETHSRYPAVWTDPFLYDMTFRLTVARDISLLEGWNLISLPYTPEDPSIEVILADISDNVLIVYGFDAETDEWFSYFPGFPGSTLIEMADDMGYWIYVDSDVTLTIYG